MAINIELNLSSDDRNYLARILGCEPGALDGRLAGIGLAALQEYVRMFVGDKVFTRGADVREYRLLLLIEHALDKVLPDEQKVSDLFQTTASQSRSLLRSILSKYQHELAPAIKKTICQELADAPLKDGLYEFTLNSESLVETMNRTLALKDGKLLEIARKKGTVSTWVVERASYDALRGHFECGGAVAGANPRP